MGSIAEVEFGQDVLDVAFDGATDVGLPRVYRPQ
jgi:hypothetical protein